MGKSKILRIERKRDQQKGTENFVVHKGVVLYPEITGWECRMARTECVRRWEGYRSEIRVIGERDRARKDNRTVSYAYLCVVERTNAVERRTNIIEGRANV